MAQVVCVGDLLIDFVPTVTGTGLVDAPAFQKAPGGAAANVAVGLARLGRRQRLRGHGGRGPVRPFPRRHAGRGRRRHGTLAVHARPRAPPWRSSPCARTASASSCSTATPAPTCCSRPMRSTPPRSTRRRRCTSTSISLASENPRASSLFAADRARAAGHLVTYDVNLRLPLWPERRGRQGRHPGRARQGAGGQAQRRRARVHDRQPRPAAVRSLWHDGLKLVTLSRGSAGSTWFTATGPERRRHHEGGRGRHHRCRRRLHGRADRRYPGRARRRGASRRGSTGSAASPTPWAR